LGCKYGPAGGIDWFFENEEKGIILEDDCLPVQSFFEFCELMLERYRDDFRVWHISGNNFNADKKLFDKKPYAFSALPQVWGWATWRNRWKEFQKNPYYLQEKSSPIYKSWKLSIVAKYNKFKHIDKLKEGLDAWDYQWQITVLNAKGLCECPAVNLVSNIGDGEDATHTKKDNRIRLPVGKYRDSINCVNVALNRRLTSHYEKKMGLCSFRIAIRNILKDIKILLKTKLKVFLRILLIKKNVRIVVASTGRSGSTMLFNAISSSFIDNNHKRIVSCLGRSFLKKLCSGYLDRIQDIGLFSPTILKTHDLIDTSQIDKAKFIFVYADPLDSAQSVEKVVQEKGLIWFEEHQYHLRGSGEYKDLYEKDVLNFENQIKTWTNVNSDRVMIIRYEELWDRVDELSDFVGFPVNLPERRERSPKKPPASYNTKLFARLRGWITNRNNIPNQVDI
jgi:hypothetical protein